MEAQFGIAAFRGEALPDQFLKPEDIHRWIQERADRERSESTQRAGTLEMLAYQRYWRLEKPRLVKRQIVVVDYLQSGSQAQYVVIVPGGVLDRLRRLSEQLSTFYPWDPVEVVTFLLAGQIPHVQAIGSRIRPQVALPVCTRIVLTIDPTCTPQEVAEVYAGVRAQEFGRLRRLSQKHAHLAIFAAQRVTLNPFDPPEQWDARREEWNSQCTKRRKPRWRYQQASVFERECRQALGRLRNIGTWGKEEISMPKAQRDSLYSRYRETDGSPLVRTP